MPHTPSSLDEPIETLSGIGPKRAALLANLGIATVRDLLFHFPRDYQDRRHITPIAEVNEGDTVTLDASASADPDQNLLMYSWTQVDGPPVVLHEPHQERPTFPAPSVHEDTDLVFRLQVTDGELTSGPDQVGVTVRDLWSQTSVFPSQDTPLPSPTTTPPGSKASSL